MTIPLAYSVEAASDAASVSRTRIYEAIRNNELMARKAGKATIIETAELQRWIRSMPTSNALSAASATEAA